ncbi:MAG: hypothetical protein U0350_41190 [Caldilineaceae bacterium]
MENSDTKAALQQLGRALHSQIEDTLTCDQCQARLPDYIQAEHESGAKGGEAQFAVAIRHHLALCPHCQAAYAQVQAWLTTGFEDALPKTVTYPTFELSFLQPPLPTTSPFTWPLAHLQKHRQQSQQWFQDRIGNLYLFFAPAPLLAEVGWAVKSNAEESLLARTSLSEDDSPGWEIEAAIFATGPDLCRVEVSLYAFAPLPDDLAGIGVALHDGVNERFALTDAHGIVEFEDVPRDRIGDLLLRIDLPAATG